MRNKNPRSELLQLVCALAFIELDAVIQLFFEPGKIASQGRAIADVALTETLQFGSILHGLHVVDGRTGDGIIILSWVLYYCRDLPESIRIALTLPIASATAKLALSPINTFCRKITQVTDGMRIRRNRKPRTEPSSRFS